MAEVKSIENYLQNVKWYEHAPGEKTQFGTYRGLLLLFDKIRYEDDVIVCKDTMGDGENSRYLSNSSKGIKHFGAGEYEIVPNQFVPLREITPPEKIHVGDYFFASAFKCGAQFKPIESFTTNPWSGTLDSFSCNSSYSLRRAFRDWVGGRVYMLKSDPELKELLKNSSVWI